VLILLKYCLSIILIFKIKLPNYKYKIPIILEAMKYLIKITSNGYQTSKILELKKDDYRKHDGFRNSIINAFEHKKNNKRLL